MFIVFNKLQIYLYTDRMVKEKQKGLHNPNSGICQHSVSLRPFHEDTLQALRVFLHCVHFTAGSADLSSKICNESTTHHLITTVLLKTYPLPQPSI